MTRLKRTAVARKTTLARRTPLPRHRQTQLRRAAKTRRRRDTGPTPATRATVRGRAAGVCEVCGLRRGVHIHHRQPRRCGTKRPWINQPSNLLWVCTTCHDSIETHRTVAYLNGWLVRAGRQPALVPVLLRDGIELLTDDGTYARGHNA